MICMCKARCKYADLSQGLDKTLPRLPMLCPHLGTAPPQGETLAAQPTLIDTSTGAGRLESALNC